MLYKVIGVMSGSSADGLDIVYANFYEKANTWSFEIIASDCINHNAELQHQLLQSTQLKAFDLLHLHKTFGSYIGTQLLSFIEKNNLHYKIDFITVHGHTVFHSPQDGFSFQLGCGANIAAHCRLPTIDQLRSMDMALGGQGAPIVPVGEKYLFNSNQIFLNIGGIANVSLHINNKIIAFDVCPANAVLNYFAQQAGLEFDVDGELSQQGVCNDALLSELLENNYFQLPHPKSLSNELGNFFITHIQTKFPTISIQDSLATYVELIGCALQNQLKTIQHQETIDLKNSTLLVSGGGAFNTFLISEIAKKLSSLGIKILIPDHQIINFKEALIMAFLGVLRWRESSNVLAEISGARQDSINGAVWLPNV